LSCHDLWSTSRSHSGRRPRRGSGAALGLLAATVVLAVGGCASDAGQPSAGSSAGSSAAAAGSAVPADELTHRIAEVEFARQCAVTSLTFPNEADITTDLDTRLAAVDLTHAQWKDWHDALVDSPALVAQLAEVSAPGCAGA
jgi:hypothetical protein